MRYSGNESSFGLLGKSKTKRATTVAAFKGYNQGIKKWMWLLLGPLRGWENSGGQLYLIPSAVLGLRSFFSAFFSFHLSVVPETYHQYENCREEKADLGPPNSASKGSQLPCSCKPSVCLASSPAKGLDLLQPFLWDTRSSPVPFSSPCLGLSGSAMTPRGRVQADQPSPAQPSPGRWPLGGKIALEEQAGVD